MSDILAFDTGPGNMVIDFVVRELSGGEKEFDRNGAWAARGNVGAQLLERLLANPYFGQSPPKTTGRELFGGAYGRRVIRYAREKQIADLTSWPPSPH